MKTVINISLMKVSEVIKYLQTIDIVVNPRQHDLFLSVEESHPYSQLTDANTYIQTQTVATLMTADQFRQMQCEVSQILSDKRWFHKLSDASKQSIKFCNWYEGSRDAELQEIDAENEVYDFYNN